MKNIVITGASEGIGKSLALEMLKHSDIHLFLISRNEAKLKSTFYNESRVTLLPFDLMGGDYNPILERISSKTQSLDIIINNAGAIVNKPFKEISHSDFDRIVNTNFKAPFFLIQSFLPLLNPGSHIVNISSMGGFQGSVKFPGLSIYSASKGALTTLTEVLATELSDKGIAVNCLAIGSVNTVMLAEAFPGYKSPISSESISQFIAWFAFNGMNWMNGKIIPVSLSTP